MKISKIEKSKCVFCGWTRLEYKKYQYFLEKVYTWYWLQSKYINYNVKTFIKL